MDRCATAYILLAEEEATTIAEAEKLFKQALKAGDGCYRRSQQLQHHGSQYEAQHSKVSSRVMHWGIRMVKCWQEQRFSPEQNWILLDKALRAPLTWLSLCSHSYLCPQNSIAINKHQSPFKQCFGIIITSPPFSFLPSFRSSHAAPTTITVNAHFSPEFIHSSSAWQLLLHLITLSPTFVVSIIKCFLLSLTFHG